MNFRDFLTRNETKIVSFGTKLVPRELVGPSSPVVSDDVSYTAASTPVPVVGEASSIPQASETVVITNSPPREGIVDGVTSRLKRKISARSPTVESPVEKGESPSPMLSKGKKPSSPALLFSPELPSAAQCSAQMLSLMPEGWAKRLGQLIPLQLSEVHLTGAIQQAILSNTVDFRAMEYDLSYDHLKKVQVEFEKAKKRDA